MPRVLNRHRDPVPPGAIFIGRPSLLGNPFIIGVHGTRDEVCDMYEVWLLGQPTLIAAIRTQLRGLDLVCFCAPRRCHGDTVLRIANEPDWREEECIRASGEVICTECGLPYWKHKQVAKDEVPTLVRACDGRLLKL